MKKYFLLICVIFVLFAGCNSSNKIAQQESYLFQYVSNLKEKGNESGNKLTINELAEIINYAEKQGNVSARSHIHQYWQLVDLYLINGDYKNAYNMILRGLRLDSWNYRYQKIASEIEIMNHEYEKAYNRLNFILNNLSELGNIYNDSLIQIAGINVGNNNLTQINLPNYYLYIATYPNLYLNLINMVSSRISEEFGIEVRIVNVGLDESEINMRDNQYSGNALLEQLTYRFNNYISDPYCLGILGITYNDIYENDYNFLFGWAQKKVGVMSYTRFLLGNPTYDQFEKRAIMQAFSSVGIIIGIPRCTHPNCSRAYPNSLEEHDRKDDKLCEECIKNLRRLYTTLN